ncbi:hypothetical protein OK015_28960 (plasmid) [Mycobacterium sp. Aquia_216]|uniref:hypothetical protein n=1 Tax=Mycobacterium sp. Aquia_216 TaxID=2991729 RepID=UPI00227C60BE|nr:hypothetical protein [Mycobacterium sp. Aquia_216]WAJ47980.1 hypothetical protein OK015_28960 [Mycobacterium sp. Aquia_216]
MSNHTEWGRAAHSLYTVRPRQRAMEELSPDDDHELTAPYVLGLWNENGDGLALQGSRRELLDYLSLATAHVQRETDPRRELNQALKGLQELRRERSAALDHDSTGGDIARLDEQEVDLLNDVAEAAAEVNDQL